ncbi:MAG: cyclic nucleotide-binding domain-containing protein [Candidatus Nitrohelix vancouverensis]|uniref:Cyclic nucleotide-binding domain-containing protein n=1 Tax=Candidatus Nitrohelix vancouverensis TaxID=2705534 RepID=A0A7T0G3Y7_9BACT|nr:MAG: cyclic nucleotide-binding domain-containing protein [Candidatus Nitrohelix vancouverensis]
MEPGVRAHLMSRHPFFTGFNRMELEEMSLEDELFRIYERRAKIIQEGEEEQALYIILSGHVSVFKATPEGGSAHIVEFRSGGIFGEFSLLRNGKRTSSVVAIESTHVCRLTPDRINAFGPKLEIKARNQVLKLVVRRYENLCQKYIDVLCQAGPV